LHIKQQQYLFCQSAGTPERQKSI